VNVRVRKTIKLRGDEMDKLADTLMTDEPYYVPNYYDDGEPEPPKQEFEPLPPSDRPTPQEMGLNVGDSVRVTEPPQRGHGSAGQVGTIVDFDKQVDGMPVPGFDMGSMLVQMEDGSNVVVFPEEVEKA